MELLKRWLEVLILSIKHPAFCEEKEWRVISFEKAKGIKKDIIDLNGMPQPVQKFLYLRSYKRMVMGSRLMKY